MRTFLAASLIPALAFAQDDAERTATMGSSISSPRSHVENYLVLPDDSTELGGEVAFVTAREGPGGEALRFTDVALLRLHARYGLLKGGAEIVFGGDFLMKQPSTTDESVWQAASVAARLGVGRKLALNVGGAGGPLLGRDGHWGTATAQLEGKTAVHDTVAFSGALGVSGTKLRSDDEPWLAEAGLRAQTIFRAGNAFGFWLGVDLAVPIAHEADVMPIDPQTRLGFHAGTVYALVDDWDFYADFAVIDRGDAADPATTLPILDGGFDQQQIIFGVIRRFSVPDFDDDHFLAL